MKRERSNLVEEDCFHSVLKLKRNEDRRPRFESRLSAGDNQTEGDLFSLSLSLFPLSRSFHQLLYLTSFYAKTMKQREGAPRTGSLRFVQVAT